MIIIYGFVLALPNHAKQPIKYVISNTKYIKQEITADKLSKWYKLRDKNADGCS